MYPNEIHTDYAYLPFGAGSRKCVGDQFACMEAVVTLAMTLRRYDFSLAVRPEEVGMFTGATIHTRNGLMMRCERGGRASPQSPLPNLPLLLLWPRRRACESASEWRGGDYFII